MSDSNANDDRLDVLLSAERDGVLDAAERRELETLLARDPDAAARRATFEAIDEALVDLGSAPLEEDAITEGLERLRARTDGAPSGVRQLDPRRAPWRHPVVPLLVGAAAAALMLYFAVGQTETAGAPAPSPEIARAPESDALDLRVASTGEATPAVEVDDEALDFDPALAIALGYGEGPDFVPGVDNADLPVISELDLLDFMASRDGEGRG